MSSHRYGEILRKSSRTLVVYFNDCAQDDKEMALDQIRNIDGVEIAEFQREGKGVHLEKNFESCAVVVREDVEIDGIVEHLRRIKSVKAVKMGNGRR